MSAAFIEAVLAGTEPPAEFDVPPGWPDRHAAGFLALRLRQLRERPSLAEWFVYSVVSDGAMIGYAGFHGPPGVNARQDADAVEIGYTIFDPYRRRGYATEAARTLIRYARERGVPRVLASVSPDNEPSLAMMRTLGFREIGHHWDDEDGDELEFELTT